MPFSPETAKAWGRVGGMARAARHDPRRLAMRGQEGLLRRLDQGVDPEGVLDPEARAKRVRSAQKAHMLRLNLLRTEKRRASRRRRDLSEQRPAKTRRPRRPASDDIEATHRVGKTHDPWAKQAACAAVAEQNAQGGS